MEDTRRNCLLMGSRSNRSGYPWWIMLVRFELSLSVKKIDPRSTKH